MADQDQRPAAELQRLVNAYRISQAICGDAYVLKANRLAGVTPTATGLSVIESEPA